jgi:hypothetical protein
MLISMQLIDIIDYFLPEIVNQFSITPWNICGDADVKDY